LRAIDGGALNPVPDGVDSRFVFKIKSESGFGSEQILEDRQLHVLGHDRESTYFVLAGDGGVTFNRALADYAAGADVEGADGHLKSLYNKIDDIEPYGPDDRRGPGLEDLPEGDVVLDVTLWPATDRPQAEERMRLLELVLQENDAQVLASRTSTRLSIVRCRLAPAGLAAVLDSYVVETVRTPPIPFIDPSDWRGVGADDLELAWTPSAAIGVLDDLPSTSHPLLTERVTVVPIDAAGHVRWNTATHHGTMTTGLALGGNFAQALRSGSAVQLRGHVFVARVLEADPGRGIDATRFPADVLPVDLIVESISQLHREHGVRVFNLSFGYDFDYSPNHVGELSEALDGLSRELSLVIVVAAGNVPMSSDGTVHGDRHIRRDYPAYLGDGRHGLAQPANAALALTVGAFAAGDAPLERNPPRLDRHAVAAIGELSPFSRTGPGHGHGTKRTNKPEFVAPGGNVVIDDTGMVDLRDQGTGVLSTALHPGGSLFVMAHGTSFAAPVVASAAASVLHAYPDASGNLVRALLATGAQHTVAGAAEASEKVRHDRFGLGAVHVQRAIESGRNRATMVFDGAMAVDTTVIHPVPIPQEFARSRSSSRVIRVALAFDPPVRRNRREYLAASMSLDGYRNVELKALLERLERQEPGSNQPLFGGHRRLKDMRPPMTFWSQSTLQVREWRPQTLVVDDGDTYYIAVTHKAKTWFRDRPDYSTQSYALTVTLEDEARIELDLMHSLVQSVSVPAQVRTRVRAQASG
jgi:hypothetical protein